MEQRPLRLGHIVDDYCPRERRITNHAIVAIVGDNIRQTRCTTCDAEHVYKEAKVPRRRKLDSNAEAEAAPGQLVTSAADAEAKVPVTAPPVAAEPTAEPAPAMAAETAEAAEAEAERDEQPEEAVSLHRRLIRATLPKVEGDVPPPRPIPEFTMHQRQGRGGYGSRHGHGPANDNVNGNVHPRHNGFRHGRPGGHGPQGYGGHGGPNGQGQGQGAGQSRPGRKGRRRGQKRPR